MSCSICGDPAVAKGRCRACYRFWLRHHRCEDRSLARVAARRYEASAYMNELRQVVRLAREKAS